MFMADYDSDSILIDPITSSADTELITPSVTMTLEPIPEDVGVRANMVFIKNLLISEKYPQMRQDVSL